jgi:drug/metabolite transporter (DMT)-like permease
VLVRDETVAPLALAGMVLVLGGAFLTSRAEHRGPGTQVEPDHVRDV